MNKKGTIALEAVIASGLALLLLSVIASQLLVFWQSWHQLTQDGRQRQWTVTAFEYLEKDIRQAQQIILTSNEIRLTLPEGNYVYRVNNENSFYRGQTSPSTYYFSLAIVDSARWWREGELVWIELTYPNESYKSCFYISGD